MYDALGILEINKSLSIRKIGIVIGDLWAGQQDRNHCSNHISNRGSNINNEGDTGSDNGRDSDCDRVGLILSEIGEYHNIWRSAVAGEELLEG